MKGKYCDHPEPVLRITDGAEKTEQAVLRVGPTSNSVMVCCTRNNQEIHLGHLNARLAPQLIQLCEGVKGVCSRESQGTRQDCCCYVLQAHVPGYGLLRDCFTLQISRRSVLVHRFGRMCCVLQLVQLYGGIPRCMRRRMQGRMTRLLQSPAPCASPLLALLGHCLALPKSA